VILAGGDGKRLLSVTRKLTGDDTPKQFCSLGGRQTLLERTRQRISRTVAEEQTLILLTRTQERFYSQQLSDVPRPRLLEQPYNHGTAPAIACSLALLERMDRDAIVAFLPSDHYFQNDDAFGDCMEAAFAQVHSDRERVVLLGIVPDAPEESYGWIQPGVPLITTNHAVFEVCRFWEKPSRKTACRLMRSGCLWNSFVMVGYAATFLDLIRRSLPLLAASLNTIWSGITPGWQEQAWANLYASIPPSNFSDQVLATNAHSLSVLRASDLEWTDLGEPQRLRDLLKATAGANAAQRWLADTLELPAY
jgi:mannose-1-phosphate guanylyltransferase